MGKFIALTVVHDQRLDVISYKWPTNKQRATAPGTEGEIQWQRKQKASAWGAETATCTSVP